MQNEHNQMDDRRLAAAKWDYAGLGPRRAGTIVQYARTLRNKANSTEA
ncbi:MAG: hypothetical protein JW955_06750 [Sedimentisphaerales bacterium]|nr:hypothetical protein [Sedimentisphaerales bacterium]